MNEYLKYIAQKYPWVVKLTFENGKQTEIQIAGESAQDCADRVRHMYKRIKLIEHIARIDTEWH